MELPQGVNPSVTMDPFFNDTSNSTTANNIFNTTDSSNITTTELPDGLSAEKVAVELLSEKDRYEMTAWAIGCGALTFFVFLLATIQYFRKVMTTPEAKRKRKKMMHKRKRALEEKAISETSSAGPIPLQDFPKSYKKKREKGLLAVEFKAIGRKAEEGSLEIASHPDHITKNAHPDALPYDNCLVELESPPASSTYINASYIDSYDEKKVYIAAQGPCRGAIGDFWHLVWQQNVRVIVMATNVFEHARQQCEKYWHNQHGRYDGIDVWLDNTDILADFSVRTFRIKLEGQSEERIVKHFQFASWSDHDCPNPSSVLECRRRVRVWMQHHPGPMLVHCGAGAGRTGAFIAIDCALEQVSQRRGVDIFNYVLYLRGCRQHMVRDFSQYEFIYATVDMFIQCGETVIGLRELPHVVKSLSSRVSGTRMNGFEQEFKTLQKVVSPLSVGECAGGHRSENRRKSRDIMLQPPERARPYLITHDSNDSTDYINAVYVDGYRDINAFIVTQWPMKSTVNDVWRLIYDYNIPSLVLLNDVHYSRSFPCFWPRTVGSPTPFGPLTIELLEENVDDNIASRLFKIKKIETLVSLQAMAGTSEESFKLLRMFQLRCWPNNNKVPTSANALLELLSRVDEWQRKHCHGRIPTLVISKNGVSRCGCYCAISHAWEKLKMEGEVDIFRAVKNIKTNRPELVENLVEYIYCYTFMVILVDLLSTTDPSLLPTSSSTPATSWDSRHPPLLLQDKIHKGRGSVTSLPKHVHFLLPNIATSQDYASRAAYFHAHEGGVLDEDELWFMSGVQIRALQNSAGSRKQANGGHSILKSRLSPLSVSSLPNGNIVHRNSAALHQLANHKTGRIEPSIETIFQDDFSLPSLSLSTIHERDEDDDDDDDTIYYSDVFSQNSLGMGLSNPAYSSLHSSATFLTAVQSDVHSVVQSDVTSNQGTYYSVQSDVASNQGTYYSVHSDLTSNPDTFYSVQSPGSATNNDDLHSVLSNTTTFIDATSAFDNLDQALSENSFESFVTVPASIFSPPSSLRMNKPPPSNHRTVAKSKSLSRISTVYSLTDPVPACFRSLQHLGDNKTSVSKMGKTVRADFAQRSRESQEAIIESHQPSNVIENRLALATEMEEHAVESTSPNVRISVDQSAHNDSEVPYVSSSTIV